MFSTKTAQIHLVKVSCNVADITGMSGQHCLFSRAVIDTPEAMPREVEQSFSRTSNDAKFFYMRKSMRLTADTPMITVLVVGISSRLPVMYGVDVTVGDISCSS